MDKDRIAEPVSTRTGPAHRLLHLLVAGAMFVLTTGCQREGPAERTGRNIDRGIERLTR
jgi:hypothetical protein